MAELGNTLKTMVKEIIIALVAGFILFELIEHIVFPLGVVILPEKKTLHLRCFQHDRKNR